MNTIKNVHLLTEYINESDLAKLTAGAALHKRHSNITFKIIAVSLDYLDVRTEQGKSVSENYADKVTLISRTNELFKKFFPSQHIHVHAIPYELPTVEVVTLEWIKSKMLNTGVRINDISKDTGIDKTNLSAWINGIRPMSQPVKALFYYYFKCVQSKK